VEVPKLALTPSQAIHPVIIKKESDVYSQKHEAILSPKIISREPSAIEPKYESDKKEREPASSHQLEHHDYFRLDPFLEGHEIKTYKREQSILKVAQSLLKMSVNKTFDLYGGRP
jgi:hypothetical protein